MIQMPHKDCGIIVLPKKVIKQLAKLKENKSESYSDVIKRLIAGNDKELKIIRDSISLDTILKK